MKEKFAYMLFSCMLIKISGPVNNSLSDSSNEALNFLSSEGKIRSYAGPTNDSQGAGYYKINYS